MLKTIVMKNFTILFCLVLFCFSCSSSSSKNSQEDTVTESENPLPGDENSFLQTTRDENNNSENNYPSSTSSTSEEDYNEGYKFGYDMGYIAGQENYEYNPYLPVGPNTRTYSYDFRKGYFAGYSEGYENGQKISHQGIYADDDENSYYMETQNEFEEVY